VTCQGKILLCVVPPWTTTMYMLFPIEGTYPLNIITERFSLNKKGLIKRERKTNKNQIKRKKALQNDLENNRYSLIPRLN
jgi:hypothetical protein